VARRGPTEPVAEVDAGLSGPAMQELLRGADYLADQALAVALSLAVKMHRPVFLEGAPGVGKTAVARALAVALEGELIRLQCYEGIDAGQALYDWDYARQMLYVHTASARDEAREVRVEELYGRDFLIERPLLRAITMSGPRVLLIDELDRADDEFDAFLLEVLADFTVTIPEIGTFHSSEPPIVIITSNRTRDVHDAIKRRCLYHWLPFPDSRREAEIIQVHLPEIDAQLAASVARAVAELRGLDLVKPPGASEAIDWAHALALLGAERVVASVATTTLGWVLKNREDHEVAERWLQTLPA
jgi:MoxR-like ATPase